jgi:thymidylate synthase (FAD)
MKVTLVSYTKAAEHFEDLENLTDLVSFCARVSNPNNQMNTETADKLIKYLLKHKHFSPFEMVNVVLEIKTTRDIAHQIVRHRSFTFQEYSQRYAAADLTPAYRLARLQDPVNRQNSIAEDVPDDLQAEWHSKQVSAWNASKEAYQWALDNGIAKEVARAVLPEGMTPTTVIMNGTLRSWIHYCDLRAANGTQLEHMLIARACAEVIYNLFPTMGEIVDV